jgi:hypothetical protein
MLLLELLLRLEPRNKLFCVLRLTFSFSNCRRTFLRLIHLTNRFDGVDAGAEQAVSSPDLDATSLTLSLTEQEKEVTLRFESVVIAVLLPQRYVPG